MSPLTNDSGMMTRHSSCRIWNGIVRKNWHRAVVTSTSARMSDSARSSGGLHRLCSFRRFIIRESSVPMREISPSVLRFFTFFLLPFFPLASPSLPAPFSFLSLSSRFTWTWAFFFITGPWSSSIRTSSVRAIFVRTMRIEPRRAARQFLAPGISKPGGPGDVMVAGSSEGGRPPA